MSTQTDTSNEDETLQAQRRMYQGLMDVGMKVGIPGGVATALFVALLLLDAGVFVSLFFSFVALVAVFVFCKMFLVHD